MSEREQLFAVQFPTEENFLAGINSIFPEPEDGVLVTAPIMIGARRVIVVGKDELKRVQEKGIPYQVFPVTSLADLPKEKAWEIHSLHHQEFLREEHPLQKHS